MTRRQRKKAQPTRSQYAERVRDLTRHLQYAVDRMDRLIDEAEGWVRKNKRLEQEILILHAQHQAQDKMFDKMIDLQVEQISCANSTGIVFNNL